MDNTEQTQTPFQQLPSRIRHYMLEYKDDNLNWYIKQFSETKLNGMTRLQLVGLYRLMVDNDKKSMTNTLSGESNFLFDD